MHSDLLQRLPLRLRLLYRQPHSEPSRSGIRRSLRSFLVSIASFFFLSCASNSAASFTALLISSSDMLEPAVMVICCSLPVPRSLADTFTIPFASISKVTSICGTPRHCRRDTIQTELSKGLVVLCELSLALQNVDINGCLVISCSREDLALLGRNGGISLNQSCCDTTHCLNGQGQRGYIQQQDITCACIACQLTALDGSADGNALIRV